MTEQIRVLVIDDDDDFRASVQALLELDGYEVRTASSGAEGLRQLKEAAPDLVILDVMMESATEGYAVNQAIKWGAESGRELPIIMISSIEASPDELFPRSEEVGAIRPDFYLTKPLDIPRFRQVVRSAVSRVARA